MKKILLISILLLFYPYLASAGTWSFNQLRENMTPWGIEVLVQFIRSPTGEKVHRILRFDDCQQVMEEGVSRATAIALRLELNYSPLNDFDLGEDSRQIMKTLILWIRNNPDATFAQAVNAYDAAYPEALWKGDQFFIRAQEWIENTTGIHVNWSQFKTYVVNNIFRGIDE